MNRLIALGLCWLCALPLLACTTFCLRKGDTIVFGKNYDWSVEDGMLVVNPRGLVRTAFAMAPGTPVAWTSTYGSVTFNQYGRDFPNGGMNEAGLVIEIMWLSSVRFPDPDDRPVIGELQWVQYHLDTAETVAEVLAGDAKMRIVSDIPIHFLIADKQGNVAAVEWLDGKMVAHTGKDLPEPALANHSYDDSLAYLKNNTKDGATGVFGRDSLGRFAKVAQRVRDYNGKDDPIDYAFKTLDRADQRDYTRWKIVYDITKGQVHFKTRDHATIKTLALNDVSFECGDPVKTIDMAVHVEGNVTPHLKHWNTAMNKDLIERSFTKTKFLNSTPASERLRLANYPTRSTCADAKAASVNE